MSDTDTANTGTVTEDEAPKVDYGEVLSEAFVTASNQLDNDKGELPYEVIKALTETYRGIPAAARGKAQGIALKAVVVSGNSNAIEALLDITNNLPKSGGGNGRVSKPSVDPTTALAIQASGLLVAYSDVTGEPQYGAKAAELASDWFQNGAPEQYKDAVLKAAAKAVKGSNGRGGSGTRATFKETLADLIGRGDIKTPATLTSTEKNGVTAKLLKNGTIKVGDEEFKNLSAAAKAVKGTGEDGKPRSVNGWDFWLYEGQPVGSYRKE